MPAWDKLTSLGPDWRESWGRLPGSPRPASPQWAAPCPSPLGAPLDRSCGPSAHFCFLFTLLWASGQGTPDPQPVWGCQRIHLSLPQPGAPEESPWPLRSHTSVVGPGTSSTGVHSPGLVWGAACGFSWERSEARRGGCCRHPTSSPGCDPNSCQSPPVPPAAPRWAGTAGWGSHPRQCRARVPRRGQRESPVGCVPSGPLLTEKEEKSPFPGDWQGAGSLSSLCVSG